MFQIAEKFFSLTGLLFFVWTLVITVMAAAVANQITMKNVDQILANGTLVVEGANIAFTPDAAQRFDQQGGKRVVDFVANGGGVFTSNNEIIAIQALGQEAFTANFAELAKENDAEVRRNAAEIAAYLWEEATKQDGENQLPFARIALQVARAMTEIKSIIRVALDQATSGYYDYFLRSISLSIRQIIIDEDELLSRLGEDIVREMVATQLARRIAFGHKFNWFEGIDKVARDQVVLAAANNILADRR
ncbi:hypothetical protein HZB07_00345 [Candidatus Saganbacteria bacterium]|nr:hypothetical protein [Candidatus Saganbacteria bacterium]